jgi:hypothetical protein
VARAALEGRVRQDLLKEVIRTLLASGWADRVGVWVEINDSGVADSGQRGSFRGIVADKDGETTPAKWSRLSPSRRRRICRERCSNPWRPSWL